MWDLGTKAVFSLDPVKLEQHCFLGLGTLFYCSFFCPFEQPCYTLQMVQIAPIPLQSDRHCLGRSSIAIFVMWSIFAWPIPCCEIVQMDFALPLEISTSCFCKQFENNYLNICMSFATDLLSQRYGIKLSGIALCLKVLQIVFESVWKQWHQYFCSPLLLTKIYRMF